MKTEPGDIIQVDGGRVIVVELKGGAAHVAPIDNLKGRSAHALKHGIDPEVTSNRILERRGKEGLADFIKTLAETARNSKADKIKLELGDLICYKGALCTVFEVHDKYALIQHPDGRQFKEKRSLNAYFFQDCECHTLKRLSEEERAANLAKIQQQQQQQQQQQPMKTSKSKTKAKSNSQPAAKPAEAKPATTPAAKVSCAGLGTLIKTLVAAGNNADETFSKAKEKYPLVTDNYIKKIVSNNVK